MNRWLLTYIIAVLFSGAVFALDSLAVVPLQLHFSSDTSEISQTFSIINTGNDSLSWTASGDAGSPWISVTPPGATIGPGFSLVTVTINRNLLSAGLNSGLVNISGDGQDTTLVVEVEVAKLNVLPKVLNFGSVDTLRTVNISNDGVGVLTWEAVANQPWISVGPDSGTTRTSLLNVRVDRSLLPPGTASGMIIITSNGGRDTVSVNLDVAGLVISPVDLDFGSIAEQKAITITNSGSGTLIWQALNNQSWLTLSPSSGSDSTRVDMRVNRSGLMPGVYGDTVRVISNGGNISIPVRLAVAGLAVSPDSLTFSPQDSSQILQISNVGSDSLEFFLLDDQTWLSLDTASGIVTTVPAQVTVSVNRDSVLPGQYRGNIFIDSNGGRDTVTVTMAFAGLIISPGSLNFSSQVDDTLSYFYISNSGSGDLSWSISVDSSWVSFSPDTGNTAGFQTDSVQVVIDRSQLDRGTHHAQITINDLVNNTSITLPITVEVAELNVNPSQVTFSSNPSDTTRKIGITNTGVGMLSWSVLNSTSWLDVSPLSGATNGGFTDSVSLTIDRGQLSPGDTSTTLTVTDLTNSGTTLVNITALVSSLSLDIDSVFFSSNPNDISRKIGITNSGAGVLNWSILDSVSWLDASPFTGTTSGGSTDSVTLIIDRSQLSPGDTSAILTVNDLTNGGAIPVVVVVSVSGLSLNTSSLIFSSIPSDTLQFFSIRNSGSGQLMWTARGDQSWIQVNPSGGITPGGDSSIVQVEIERDSLPSGQSMGTVFVRDSTNNVTHSLAVIVNKTNLALSDTLIDLGSSVDVSTGRFQIFSTGSGDLGWRLEPDSSWLTVNPMQGSGSDTVSFTVERRVLPPRSSPYSGRIVVIDTTNQDTQQVRILVEVAALELSSQVLHFRSDSAGASPDSFRIINTGSGELHWEAVPESTWLVVSPSTGNSNDTILVTVLENLLDPGFHQSLVRVEDLTNHTRDTVRVEVEKVGAQIRETRLDFDSNIDSLTFYLANSGAGILNWQIQPITLDTVWFELSDTQGTLPAGDSLPIGVGVHRERVNEFTEYLYPLEVATDAGVLTIDVVMDVDQLEINHDSGQLGSVVAGNPVAITATITDSGTTSQATLLYRTGAERAFTEIEMSSNDGKKYQAIIPGNAITDLGVEYFIQATNRYQKTSRTDNSSFPVRIDSGITNPERQPAERYRLVSLPLNLDNKDARAVLQPIYGNYDANVWRFFQLDQDGYAEINSANSILIRPGEAYWLILRDATKSLSSGAGETILLNRPYQIPLRAGFNFVANPFTFEVPFSQLKLSSGLPLQLYFWEDAWFPIDSSGIIQTQTQTITGLTPFQGVALANTRTQETNNEEIVLVPDTLLVYPRPIEDTQTNPFPKAPFSSVTWQVRIHATSGDLQDPHNYVRVGPGSRDEFDQADYPEPPVIGDFLSLYFSHPQWPQPIQKLAVDQRAPSDKGHLWPMEIRSRRPGAVDLSFEGLNQLPSGFQAWLVDGRSGELFDLSEAEQIRIPYNDPKYTYPVSLIIGTESFVAGKIAELDLLPKEYSLFQNYPNPFNPVTTIRFGLPEAQRVRITIYNLLGQRVRQLIKDQTFQAGYHARNWDGRSDAGVQVASGIYLYRLEAGNFHQAHKMILIR